MKFVAIIERKDGSTVRWFKTQDEADTYLTEWLRNNPVTREIVRLSIAECLFSIEG